MVLLRVSLKEALKKDSFHQMGTLHAVIIQYHPGTDRRDDDILPHMYHREYVLIFISYLSLTRLEIQGRNVML